MPASSPPDAESLPLPGVPRADAELLGMCLMEMLERMPFGEIHIKVANRQIAHVLSTDRYTLEELKAAFSPMHLRADGN